MDSQDGPATPAQLQQITLAKALAEAGPPWFKAGDQVILAPAEWQERVLALEALWAAIKDSKNWRVGYNPAVTAAIAELRKLEAGQ
jgi:hypothetical protein